MRPRVVVAASQALVVEAFARLVETALRLRPDLVLTDVSLPCLRSLAAEAPWDTRPFPRSVDD